MMMRHSSLTAQVCWWGRENGTELSIVCSGEDQFLITDHYGGLEMTPAVMYLEIVMWICENASYITAHHRS